MKKNLLFILMFCILIIGCTGCDKKTDDNVTEDINKVDEEKNETKKLCMFVLDRKIMTKEDIESFTNNISLDIKPFINAIKQTIYAASTAENNSIYNGVFMSINEKNLEMAATDGARLSMVVETIENKENKTLGKCRK